MVQTLLLASLLVHGVLARQPARVATEDPAQSAGLSADVASRSSPDPRYEKLYDKMKAASEAGRAKKAERYARKVLAVTPDDAEARFVLAMALYSYSQTAKTTAEATLWSTLSDKELEKVAAAAPDTTKGVLARMFLRKGGPTLAVSEPQCPKDASEAEAAAEKHFAVGEWRQAIDDYEQALQTCPENSVWWTWYGDGWFKRGDMEHALAAYDKAIQVNACNFVAHRFAADVQIRTGKVDEAVTHLVVAVSCNPMYEVGWSNLDGLVTEASLAFYGMPVDKAEFAARPLAIEGPASEVQAARLAWQTYAKALGDVVHEMPNASPLAREREVVVRTLQAVEGTLPKALPRTVALRPWVVLARARADDRLDTAILVLLLDMDLAPEFIEKHNASPADFIQFVARYLIWNEDGTPILFD
jgi:tetratricopeptide (TPR) repeat protein